MSRIGNKPIEIPEKVEINIDGNKINVKGPKGELVTEVLEEKIKFEISDNVLQFTRESDEKQVKSLHGLYRSLVANNIVGVSDCLLYTSPSPRDGLLSRMPSSA